MKTCPECNGEGVIEKGTDDEQQCPTCGGCGFVPDDDDNEEVIRTVAWEFSAGHRPHKERDRETLARTRGLALPDKGRGTSGDGVVLIQFRDWNVRPQGESTSVFWTAAPSKGMAASFISRMERDIWTAMVRPLAADVMRGVKSSARVIKERDR